MDNCEIIVSHVCGDLNDIVIDVSEFGFLFMLSILNNKVLKLYIVYEIYCVIFFDF